MKADDNGHHPSTKNTKYKDKDRDKDKDKDKDKVKDKDNIFAIIIQNFILQGGGIPVDFSKTENIVIVLILIAIMIGMCTGMIYNLVRKLSEDKEDVIASREKVAFSKIKAQDAKTIFRPYLFELMGHFFTLH